MAILSFVEVLVIFSKAYAMVVATELFLWISFLVGVIQHVDLENLVINGPIITITVCIVVKIILAFTMQKKLQTWMKYKAFLKRMGKFV